MGDPSVGEERIEEAGAGGSSEVVASFGPVQAAPGLGAFAGSDRRGVDPDAVEQFQARWGERDPVVDLVEMCFGDEVFVELSGEFAGKVFVAGAGERQGCWGTVLWC